MADACQKAGAVKERLSAVDEALALVKEYDERYVEPEIYRLKGELLHLSGEPESQIEEYFRQAIEASRRRLYKSWELRAAMSY